MSAILKALRKQQSPLLQERHPIAAGLLSNRHGSAESQATLKRSLLVVTALVVGATLGFTLQYLRAADSVMLTENKRPAAEGQAAPLSANHSVPLNWGEATAIPEVQLNWRNVDTVSVEPAQTEPSSAPSASSQPALQTLNRDAVSPELLARFEQAVAATTSADNRRQPDSVIPNLTELSASFQQRVPKFAYNSHMYSSLGQQRWIKLNDRVLREGDRWQGIEVVSIEPQRTVLDLNGELFSVEALTDWQ